MAGENGADLRQSQLGVQNALFTAVAANILLQSVSIEPKPVVPTQMLYRDGDKAAVDQVLTKGAHTTAKLTGFGAYNDLAYIISTLAKAATITTPGGATTARDWTWILLSRSAETPKFMTVETGIAGTDYNRFADANLTALKLDFEENREVVIDGDMIGSLLAEEGVTPTANPTNVAKVPISVNFMDAYISDVLADIDDGLLGKMYKCNMSIGGRRQAVFPIRSDRPSLGGYVETRNKATAHIEIEHDTQSYARMSQMRKTETAYLKYVVTGPEIEAGFRYELEMTMPFKVTSPDRGANDKVYQGMYDLEAVNDATLGGFLKIRLRCALSALTAAADLASGQQPGVLMAADIYEVGGSGA